MRIGWVAVKKLLFCLHLVLIGFALSFSTNVLAKPQTLASLKAAYVYNIAKFTRWPEATWGMASDPFLLCLYGEGEVISELKKLQGRHIGEHPIQILMPEDEASFTRCHALYVSATERRRYRYVLSLVTPGTVLTLSDDERFLRFGGLIYLTEKDQRLRFVVDMARLSQLELQLSSKLLKLAIRIHEGGD